MNLHMAFAVGLAFSEYLLLVVINHHLGSGCRLGVGYLINEHVNHVVASHLGCDGKVTDDNVLLLLYVVVIVESVRITPFSFVAVFLIIVCFAIPILGFTLGIVHHCMFHFVGSQDVIGRTEVEAQLIHSTRLHIDIVGKHDGVGLPLCKTWVVELQTHFLFQPTGFAYSVSVGQIIILNE